MMNVRDLRIGNYLCDPEIGQKHEFIVSAHDLLEMATEHNEYRAIQLTEEWLLKFGFEYYGGNTSESHYQIIPDDLREFNLNHIHDSNQFFFSDVEIKTIHHLQNLYFALVGEELKVK